MEGNMVLRLKKVRPGAQLPQRQTAGSAGFDLCACISEPVVLEPGDSALFPTGLAAEIPQGHVGLIFTRSGLGVKHGVAVSNGVGVIDSDYRGELKTAIHNHGSRPQVIEPGERIAQLVLVPYLTAQFLETDTLSDTQRGTGGFGSTGTR